MKAFFKAPLTTCKKLKSHTSVPLPHIKELTLGHMLAVVKAWFNQK